MINKETEEYKSKSSSIMYLFLLAFACITFLAACGLDKDEARLVGTELWEETDSTEQLPKFLSDHTQHSIDLYVQVHEHTHVMGMLNCYCGCMMDNGIDEPHDSLLRCYIVDFPTDDGSVTWTDHSTMCGLCKAEMELVVEMKQVGSSDDEVKAAIVKKYAPTD